MSTNLLLSCIISLSIDNFVKTTVTICKTLQNCWNIMLTREACFLSKIFFNKKVGRGILKYVKFVNFKMIQVLFRQFR